MELLFETRFFSYKFHTLTLISVMFFYIFNIQFKKLYLKNSFYFCIYSCFPIPVYLNPFSEYLVNKTTLESLLIFPNLPNNTVSLIILENAFKWQKLLLKLVVVPLFFNNHLNCLMSSALRRREYCGLYACLRSFCFASLFQLFLSILVPCIL